MKKLTKKSKILLGTPILVRWIDPATTRGGWRPASYVIERANECGYGSQCMTVGIFVYKNADYISIALNRTEDEWDDTDNPSVTEVMEIPIAVIKEMWELE